VIDHSLVHWENASHAKALLQKQKCNDKNNINDYNITTIVIIIIIIIITRWQ